MRVICLTLMQITVTWSVMACSRSTLSSMPIATPEKILLVTPSTTTQYAPAEVENTFSPTAPPVPTQILPTSAPESAPESAIVSLVGCSVRDSVMLTTTEQELWLVAGSFLRVDIPDAHLISGASGSNHTLLLSELGRIYGTGYNTHGQLGLQGDEFQESPIEIPGIENVVSVGAGSEFSLALLSDGRVWTWGLNDEGQLGYETTNDSQSQPTAVPGISDIVAISGGGAHVLALHADGTIVSWGRNDEGQLGGGMLQDRPYPVQIQGLNHIIVIAAGVNHSIALRDDGTVWRWGAYYSGSEGYESFDGYNVLPVQVTGLPKVVDISAGRHFSLARTEDGKVWAWGLNSIGQLGAEAFNGGFIPFEIPGLFDVKDIAAGRLSAFALQSNGTLWGWGDQLVLPGIEGDGAQVTPVKILEISSN
jgi:alpha-tubulin suppressor-like RCC1 family protein